MTDTFERLKAALADRYAIQEELGAGGMATVYLAQDLKHDREVAVKVLRPDLAATLGTERFLREIKIAAQLHHPHILPLYDSGEAGGFLYYAMPYEEGQSLRDKLTHEGELPITEAIRFLRDVADALAHAHQHGVVHRDIKPENIMLSGHHALVTDFGVAKAVSEATGREKLTTVGVALGTPAYMAPEQASADPLIDHRADIYAVGALAYELLAGRPPFAGATAQMILSAHITEPPEPVTKYRESVPPALAQLVMRCLEKKPADRFQSADEMVEQLEQQLTPTAGITPVDTRPVPAARGARVRWGIGFVALVVVVAVMVWRSQQRAWARGEALAEIQTLAEANRFDEAYVLADRALGMLPEDSSLKAIAAVVSAPVNLTSEPAGAQVFRKPYTNPDDDWQFIGTTPLGGTTVPAGWSRIRLEAAGFQPYELAVTSLESLTLQLEPEGESGPLAAMISVPLREVRPSYWITGLGHLGPQQVKPFRFGRFEVTNQQFKAFVDAGGYRQRDLWLPDLSREDRSIAWEEVMARMTDRTGRPGPSTWELGDYPAGTADEPVHGISWYEAAAYARYVGAQLPTVYHWMLAASSLRGDVIIPLSNVGTDGPAAVGSFSGMSAWGAFDVAGNVREWTQNAMGNQRIVLGGSWAEPDYMFYHANPMDPFDRSELNGLRLAIYPQDPESAVLSAPVERHLRDFASEEPASDEVFSVYRRLYDNDDVPIQARVEAVDTTTDWLRERITFPSPQEGEVVIAYLFLPRNVDPPYQTLVFFPGANSLIGQNPMPADGYGNLAPFVTKGGRAWMHPIYKGTFDRRAEEGVGTWYPSRSSQYRDLILVMGRELRRSVDYLETRDDIAHDQLGYFGWSWGGYLSGIMMAIEPRFKTAILQCPGLAFERPQPEVDPFHFLPRVRIPVLMVDGRYDAIFPYEASQVPMFNLLGTPPEQKRHVVVESAHCPPRAVFYREALTWLDRYLGAQ